MVFPIIFESKINKPLCNKDVTGGIRRKIMKEFTKYIRQIWWPLFINLIYQINGFFMYSVQERDKS